MRFASSIAHDSDFERVVTRLVQPIGERLTPGMVDLALVFITPHFEDDTERVLEKLADALPTAHIIGCTAEGTIGEDREIERLPSMSLLAASLPEVDIRPFHIRQQQLHSAHSESDWERLVGVSAESKPVFVAFADPFSIAVHDFLDRINENYLNRPLVGGIASGARAPQQNRLVIDSEVHREGLVGVALTGNLNVETVVSQGCRPIGKPFIITRGEQNIVHELGGKPALQRLHEVFTDLSEEEEDLVRQSLFLGRVIDEHKQAFRRGDFLIHNIMGADRKTGALGIAGHARRGATVQFHVRDAESADEDLRLMLSSRVARDVEGAMLFGCNGRGTHMWPKPGHDVGVLREVLGEVPVAGFFCAGEFGPVGGKNFVHGFTASIALFSQP